MTEQEIVDMILENAQERPMQFVEILTRCVLKRADGQGVLVDALRIQAQAFLAEAEALRAEGERRGELIDFTKP